MKYTLCKYLCLKDRRTPEIFLRSVLVVSTFLLAIGGWFFWNHSSTWYGYVVGDDRRIYMVNLEKEELVWVSEELDQIGNPTEIDINREDSILYIASGPEGIGERVDYAPLVAVKLSEKAELIFESWIDPSYLKGSPTESAIYYLRLSPDSDVIYAAYGNLDYQRRTILNASNAEIIGQNDIFITKGDEFSPDGKMLAQVYPGLLFPENGIPAYPGIIVVWDLETGEQILRTEHEGNEDLYPPWESPSDRWIHIRWDPRFDFHRYEVYDRKSGEQLAIHNFREAFEVGAPGQRSHVTRIPGSKDVAMTLGGYIVVFDPITTRIKSQTYVSDSILTEVVVTDKPLIRTDIKSVRRPMER